jgi:hypothetical protein
MTFARRKLLVLAAWAGMVLAMGATVAIGKPELWVLIGSLAIIPVVIGNRLWETPEATLSQLIATGRSQS